VASYLDSTFLGEPVDDVTTQVGSAGNLAPMTPDGPTPIGQQLIKLPFGITIPRQTAILIIVIAIVVWLLMRKKNALRHVED
jgi:hypothetical protein